MEHCPGSIYYGAPFPLSRHVGQNIINHAPNVYSDNDWRTVSAKHA
jgi:hypothetical protein